MKELLKKIAVVTERPIIATISLVASIWTEKHLMPCTDGFIVFCLCIPIFFLLLIYGITKS